LYCFVLLCTALLTRTGFVDAGCQLYCFNKNNYKLGMLLLESLSASSPATAAAAAAPPTGGPPAPGGLPTPPTAATSTASAVPLGPGWKVSLVAERSAEEMVAIHVKAEQWEAALTVAIAYHLDCDHIYK
jgi:hypothetical protein